MNAVTVMDAPEVTPHGQASAWSRHLGAVAIFASAILITFWRDAWAMGTTWWNISTYNHCLLILPVVYWLVEQRRSELKKITPSLWWPGLVWITAASLGWMLGEAAGVSFARQLGLVMMLQGVVITFLGKQITKGLMFPLFYAFFLVPFGEETVPFLQTVTAKMSMTMLGWADIPAYIDGVFISTPTGYFEVAEACSGVKFLIAMIAYGALVSNVCFESWKRRALFMTAAIAVPIIANGIRAFGTIYIAHHTTTDFASGFDHVFYGWFFFAFVLILVMVIGWPFFDRKIDDRMIDGDKLASQAGETSTKPLWKYGATMAAVIIAPTVWLSALSAQTFVVPEKVTLPQVKGWEVVDYNPSHEWDPKFVGASHKLLGRYRNTDTGAEADLVVAVYNRQEEGREIVGYGQGAFDPGSKWSWVRDLAAPKGSAAIQITAPGPVVRDTISFYRIGGKLTGSAMAVKLETLRNRLFGSNPQAVAILVSSEKTGDTGGLPAAEQFLNDLGPVDKLADEMAGLR